MLLAHSVCVSRNMLLLYLWTRFQATVQAEQLLVAAGGALRPDDMVYAMACWCYVQITSHPAHV